MKYKPYAALLLSLALLVSLSGCDQSGGTSAASKEAEIPTYVEAMYARIQTVCDKYAVGLETGSISESIDELTKRPYIDFLLSDYNGNSVGRVVFSSNSKEIEQTFTIRPDSSATIAQQDNLLRTIFMAADPSVTWERAGELCQETINGFDKKIYRTKIINCGEYSIYGVGLQASSLDLIYAKHKSDLYGDPHVDDFKPFDPMVIEHPELKENLGKKLILTGKITAAEIHIISEEVTYTVVPETGGSIEVDQDYAEIPGILETGGTHTFYGTVDQRYGGGIFFAVQYLQPPV